MHRIRLLPRIFVLKWKIKIKFWRLLLTEVQMRNICTYMLSKIYWNYGKLNFLTVNFIAQNLHRTQSINLLVKNGLSSDAWPIVRVVLESSLDYTYIIRHPQKISRYFDYSIYLDIQKFERYRRVKEIKKEDISKEEKEFIENLYSKWDKVKDKFTVNGRVKQSWRDINLIDIAKEIGYEELYTSYKIASDYAHGNSNMIQDFILGINDKGLILKAGTSYNPEEIIQVISTSGLMFIHILFLANKEYDLKLNKKLTRLRIRYEKLSLAYYRQGLRT